MVGLAMVGVVLGSVFGAIVAQLVVQLRPFAWAALLWLTSFWSQPLCASFGRVPRDSVKELYNPLKNEQVGCDTPDKNVTNVADKVSKRIYKKSDVGANISNVATIADDTEMFRLLSVVNNLKSENRDELMDNYKKNRYDKKLTPVLTKDKSSSSGVAEILTVSVMRLKVNTLPDISRACSRNNYSCYRNIIPWVSRVNRDVGFILNDVLPESGPISSMELGSALAQIVCDFNLNEIELPCLMNTIVDDSVYLHFDSMKLEVVSVTICKLFAFNGYVGASLEPTAMIKAAASVGAPTIAANEASAIFREQLSNMIKVETVLTNEDQDIINRERTHVRYLQSRNITNDHPLMAAYREIIRQDFDHMFNVRNTKLRTLILGASSREIKIYNNNKNVFFQIALLEGKDMNRFVIDCLSELKETKSKKLHKKRASGNEQVLKRAIEAVVTVKSMIEEWKQSRKLPDRFMLWDESILLFKGRLGIHNFDVIVFQDVGYNFDEKEWVNIFASTGASVAYGYMCLPWELIEPKLLSSYGYVYRVDGDKSKLAYYGYANGYVHNTKDWGTLMHKLVMNGTTFSIIVEFVARVGPMTCIRLVKSNIKEVHVRNLEIPDFLKTVQLLDIVESFNSRSQKLDLNNLVYFPVKASEFYDVVNYALDVAKESINFNTILLYIRRRCSGISLVTKDIAKSWTAPKHKLPSFALVVYLYTYHMVTDFGDLKEKGIMIMPSKFKLFVRRLFVDTKVMEMFRNYYEYFLTQNLFHILVKDVDHSFWQEGIVRGSKRPMLVYDDPNPEDMLDVEEEEDDATISCNMCLVIKNVAGSQIFTCDRNVEEIYNHSFNLNNDELTKLKATLSDTSKDNVGIRGVKELALAKVPPSVFSHNADVYYLSGPPGTGKSYLIRALATRDDLIITPFARLKQDYTNFVHPITKQKTSLKCYTQHAAFMALNHPRIFVDEYTAMPYEFLTVIVHNCAAHEVYLVGDHRQVHLINEVEGVSINTKIDFSKLRSHELIRNYRNPKDAVFVLNTIYMYNMVNMKDFTGFKFDVTDNYKNYEEHTPLFFRYSTAECFGVDSDTCQKVTVRSNQGATYSKVKLIITENDKDVFNIPSMAIVALSRHTDECVILNDKTTVTDTFVQMLISSIDRPRTAELPKLSPVCITSAHEKVQRSKHADSEEKNDSETATEEVKGDNIHADKPSTSPSPTTEKKVRRKRKYKLKVNILTKSYEYIASMQLIIKLVMILKVLYRFIFILLVFIRDFDRQSIIDLKNLIINFIRLKLLSLIFEEENDEDQNENEYEIHDVDESDNDDQHQEEAHGTNDKPTTTSSTQASDKTTSPSSSKTTKQSVDKGKHKHHKSKNDKNAKKKDKINGNDENVVKETTDKTNVADQGDIQNEDKVHNEEDQSETLNDQNETATPSDVPLQEEASKNSDLQKEEYDNLQFDSPSGAQQSDSTKVGDNFQEFDKTTSQSSQTKQSNKIFESPEYDVVKDLNKLPSQNVCMLQALGVLSGNTVTNVWKSMLIAVGPETASELYNHPWSTDEMQNFCYLNNLTVTVLLDDKDDMGCVYGTGQNHIGVIHYSSKGIGHFYVREENKPKHFHINLITDENSAAAAGPQFDKFYITNETLKQLSSSGDTPYNTFVYEIILNYMCDGSLEHMIGGETDMLNHIGICNAIYVKGNLPEQYHFLKRKQTNEDILLKLEKTFSKPLLIIDMLELTLSYVITASRDYTKEIASCKTLSEFLRKEHIPLSGLDSLLVNYLKPNDIKHLSRSVIRQRLHKIIFNGVRRLNSTKVLSGGTVPQLHPFNKYAAVKPKEVSYIPLKGADEGFKSMARLFANPIYLSTILVEDKPVDDNEFALLENTSFDAFKMLFEDMATIDEYNFELANQEALGYLDKEFGSGLFNLTAYDNINQKFKPLSQTESAWSLLNVAPGVTYFKSHLTQSLFCLQMRYLTRAFISTHNVQSIDKAREIAELFFYEHMELNFDIFNEQDIYQTVLESEKAMEEKHYDKQADFEVSGDTIVRFSMKDIFKPFKTSIDLFKPGQGISAWSKNLQTIFQTSFRIINKHFINCLKSHVIFDNGIDELALMSRVNSLLKLLPDIAINGVIDATACDSGQNKFTQMIERIILEKLGINDYFLDWYYSHREEYTLKGYHVTATINDIKTSGEPATLLNNTILMACLMNYLIRGDGPSVLVIKGDDGLKRQLNLRCNESVLPILRNYLKMDFKIDINVPITFCGYFLSGSNLVPDIIRKCFKIAGHRFRDYSHFAEYQQSLRDWVLNVNKMSVEYVCDVTACSYKFEYEFVASLFESIVSLTHINERQFRSTFKYKMFKWSEDYEHSTPWKDKLPWYQG